MNDIFSIEYAHYDGSTPLEEVIAFSNKRISPYLNIYEGAQKTIMFDDIHSKLSYSDYEIKLRYLLNSPDCIYAESSFEPLMVDIFKDLEKEGYTHVKEDGKDYITRKDKIYNHNTTFLIRTYDHTNAKFSCPSLVAASYLYKLGYFSAQIRGLNGEILNQSKEGRILSILPSKYLQVEANARSIIEVLSPQDIDRIEYIFY